LFEALARFVTDRRSAWLIVFGTLLVTVLSAVLSLRLEKEDDVLAFLPATNPEVKAFQDINQRFGGLDVALIGVQSADVFAPAFQEALKATTTELDDLQGVDNVLTLANVQDFQPDPMGGIRSATLIEAVPTDAAGVEALRARVMSREQVVGNLVDHDGKAVMLYVFKAWGTDTRTFATAVEAIVKRGFPNEQLYWGGAPFVSRYIFDATERDLARLTPWAVAAILAVMLLAFRDLVGTLLGVMTTAVGIFVTQAMMVVAAERFNIVLGSMPVILFAVGSAYGIQVLSRYYLHALEGSPAEAVRRTLVDTGPVVVLAGLTTIAGMGSFVMMDILPLRVFGIYTALGVLITMIAALTFIPAVLVLVGVKGHRPGGDPLRRVVIAVARFAGTKRLAVGLSLGLVALVGVAGTTRLDTRMDQASFYDPGTPPDEADRFLRERFGGSLFVQIWVKGDTGDPELLRELSALGDRLSLLPGVAQVQHVGDVLLTMNEAMDGQKRLPDSAQKVGLLHGLLAGNPAIRQLLSDDRQEALIHIRLRSSELDAVADTLVAIEAMVKDTAPTRFTIQPRPADGGRIIDRTVSHLLALCHKEVADCPAAGTEAALRQLVVAAAAIGPDAADRGAVARRLTDFLQSGESSVLLEPAAAEALGAALAALGAAPEEAALRAAIQATLRPAAGDPLEDDLLLSLDAPLRESWSAEVAVARAAPMLEGVIPLPAGAERRARFEASLRSVLLDLDSPTVAVPAEDGDHTAAWVVSGLPIMHRGLSDSVTGNQLRSLAFSIFSCAALLVMAMRSLSGGLVAAAPTALTILVLYGAMGFLGVHLDIGTSMLASIVIGAAVDYALHQMSAWYATPEEPLVMGAIRSAARVSTATTIGAVAMAAGFFVLTLGEARPLRNVGGLTSAGMLLSALSTFLVLPVLARRRSYFPNAAEPDPADEGLPDYGATASKPKPSSTPMMETT
jgi:predicted RND superfamily exporter protein